MRVLISGGTGLVGQPISRKFAQNGWETRVIGIEESCDLPGISYRQCDILDFEALLEQVEGCDAVVHLAAIPSTLSHPNPRLFRVNVSGTFNLFEAAALAGVKRIAQASSINALGGYWGCDDRQFNYFPLDEAHPIHTTDAYSLSKQLVEEIAAYYWRRAGISSVSFRLPAVWTDAIIKERELRDHLRQKRERLQDFRKLPASEQRRRLTSAREKSLALRSRHVLEYEAARTGALDRQTPGDGWLFSSYFFDRYNYWTFIHSDDSTQAFELAVTADFQGAHPLFVNSDRNYLGCESEALLSLFFPDVQARSVPIHGAEALVNCDRAADLLGFAPGVRQV